MFDPPLGALLECARGVREQRWRDWEWCVVDDCSTRPEIVAALDELAVSDPRIRVVRRAANGGIVAASNDALAMAGGEFVAFLDHDDRLLPHALDEVARVLDEPANDAVDYLYTDEMHVLADGSEANPFPKPDWSPERFRASMYTCHLSVIRREVVEAAGGFRVGFDGSQDHDLVLRCTELIAARGGVVAHLPEITYHWRHITTSVSRTEGTLDRAVENGRRAVQDQCDRLGIDARVEHGPVRGTYRVVRTIDPDLPVTVVVATRGETSSRRPYRLAAVETMHRLTTTHRGARLVVVFPPDLPAELISAIDEAAGDRWQLVPWAGPWSLGGAVDRAVEAYPAHVVVTVAPGWVPRADATPDWLEVLAGLAVRPGVGMVGGLLAAPDGVVLDAGTDLPGFRMHPLEGLRVGSPSAGNDLLIERECTTVSLAAAATTVAHWREGRDPLATDWYAAGRSISLTLQGLGAATLWTPYARFDLAVATGTGDGLRPGFALDDVTRRAG